LTTSVRPYDFRPRETFDRHDVSSLNSAFDDFTRHATVEVSTLLGRAVDVSVRPVVAKPWHEVVAILGDTPYLATFALEPFEGEAILATSRVAALRWVELRLGGGKWPSFSGHTTPTSTDFAVLAGIVTPLLDLLALSLSNLKPVSSSLTAQGATSQFVQLAGPTETFILATLQLAAAKEEPVDVVLAFPVALVRQFTNIAQSGPRALGSGEAQGVDETVVLQTPIVLSVELPSVELTLQEISDLAVGDVIPFLHPLSQPLDVRAEGVLVARAKQGHVSSKIVCSITEEITEDDR
jgi:flagellar motor switch protein FliM